MIGSFKHIIWFSYGDDLNPVVETGRVSVSTTRYLLDTQKAVIQPWA